MFNVAIIEDDVNNAETLLGYVNRFSIENRQELNVSLFSTVEDFFVPRGKTYEIVFFDIELPGQNGMNGAKLFREQNADAVIIFTTNLRQYVLKGYEVGALDYMIKPITFENVSAKLTKAIEKLETAAYKVVLVHTKNGIFSLRSIDITYIEVRVHTLTVHTYNKDYETTGNLTIFEDQLKEKGFSRCNSCYLVNMRCIESVNNLTITLKNSNDTLLISRRKKKEFMDDFTHFCGN